MKIMTRNVKVRVTLRKGKMFVVKVVNDVSERTNSMTGRLKMVDGKYHLHNKYGGYYIINPKDVKDIRVV